MSPDEQERLVTDLARSLASVSRDEVIAACLGHFSRADAGLGERLARTGDELRAR